jgi:hypothetical protein
MKQFCLRGHDTFICGRTGYNCNDCRGDWRNRTHTIKKQFCLRGHDTLICGRTKNNGQCIQCRKDEHPGPIGRHKGSKNKNPRKRNKLCSKGHDKDIVGRTNNGSCKECVKINQRVDPTKDSRLKRFCVKNHDTFQTGRSKEGNCKKCQGEWMINKVKMDIKTKLKYHLRKRLREAIKGNYKSGSAVGDLGCTIEFLKKYLENKFYNKMTWDNWGTYWQLDHIQELHTFDLTDKEQFLKAVHYTNLQPLTIPDHKKKTIENRKK